MRTTYLIMFGLWKKFKDPALPNDYFRVHVTILRFFGIELYREESHQYKVFSKMFLFQLIIIFTGLEIYELFVQLGGELASIAKVTNYLLAHIMGGFETILLYNHRKMIGNMMRSLHNPPYQPNDMRGGVKETIWIRETVKITELMYILFLSFMLVTVLITTPGEAIYVRLTRPQTEWTMPFAPMSIGEFQKHSPFFEISMLYQVLEIVAYGFIILTTYLLMCTLMAHISCQMKIVALGLRTLRSRAEQLAGYRSNDEEIVNQYMSKLMRDSIEHHLDVLNLADEMEILCSTMILIVVGCSVILMCFLLYFGSLYPIGSIEFIHFFFYWWTILWQVASYCYWGNEVTLEAENVAKAAAEIQWPGAPNSVTTAIILIINKAQRPLFITAGKFLPLSMQTLERIVKGSFSYFTVLKQTQSEVNIN